MLHYANVTPPEHSRETLEHFDLRMMQSAHKITHPAAHPVLLNHAHGGGLPTYAPYASDLFLASQARCRGVDVARIELVSKSDPLDPDLAAHLAAQYDGQYLFFGSVAESHALSPFEFRVAMCIRLGVYPRGNIALPTRCECGHLLSDQFAFITHAFSGCQRFSNYTPTHRHTLVKSTIVTVLSRYGFLTTPEPPFYTYADGIRHRPDITVFSSTYPTQRSMPPISTDLVISASDGKVGDAATAAARIKTLHHTQATNALDHEFIPLSFEIHGHQHEAVDTFYAKLASHLPNSEYSSFIRDMKSFVATALAKARVATIIAFRTETRTFI
jgi:hypothetical protein